MHGKRGNRAAAFAIALAACAMLAWPPGRALAQQKFPTKPVRIIVSTTPGATPDILARLIGPKLSDTWGQPVVIENRPGANGILAANLVAKSAPDGYTVTLVSPAFAIRAALYPELPYDSIKDFATVCEIGFSNSIIVVPSTLGPKTVKEFIHYAHANPGKMFFGSSGAGTATHLGGERFRIAAGIRAQHVGFKGQSEFQIEVAAGRIQFASTSLTAAMGLIKDGRLHVIAAAMRTDLLPGVPSYGEAIPGWGRDGTQSVLAPAGTPMAIRQQISREVTRILALPDIKARLDGMTFQITPTTPEEHARNLRNDIAIFSKIIKEAGLKPN